MDELDLLKKDWQKPNKSFPKLSQSDIYKMIHSKSSSIVKWIFIISIVEFVLWTAVSFLLKDSKAMEEFKNLNADLILIPLTIAGYVILAYFFYLFFKNYKNISVTDSAKSLMETILKTRKTVRHYVAFNLIFLAISTFTVLFLQIDQNQDLNIKLQQASADGEIFKFYAVIILTTMVALVVAVGLLLLFYWLIYGLLLNKLNRNYKELKKMDL